METKTNNKEIKELIHVIKLAAFTYKKVSSNYPDDHLEHFIECLAKNHKGFIKDAGGDYDVSDDLPIKNQMKSDAIFEKGSAIGLLLLCKNVEKEILKATRNAVHGSNGETKKMLCKQLVFSENALFEADKLLEGYE